MRHPVKRSLKRVEWPAPIALRFARLVESSDDDDCFGAKPHLSINTIISYQKSLGNYLRFAYSRGTLSDQTLENEFMRRNFGDFVSELFSICAASTVIKIIGDILCSVRRMYPEEDYTWLKRLTRRMKAGNPRNPRITTLTTDLNRSARRSLERANREGSYTLTEALHFRDAVICGLLCEAPMRMRNLVALKISDVIPRQTGWRIFTRAEFSKTQRTIIYELSPTMSKYMEIYIRLARNSFPNSYSDNALWLSRFGRGLKAPAIASRICQFSAEHFHTRVTTHDFRRAAGATLATHAHEQVYAVRDLLGHRSFRTTEKHYLPMAQTLQAGRRLASIVEERIQQI